MTATANDFQPLQLAAEALREAINAVPDHHFTAPMAGWSPRDVVAHLIHWNRLMIAACQSILKGETPTYYADHAYNYRNINAEAVAKYNSLDKSVMLSELETSLGELQAFARGLNPADLDAETGVMHYRGVPATVTCTLGSLAQDYEEHAREIREWLAASQS